VAGRQGCAGWDGREAGGYLRNAARDYHLSRMNLELSEEEEAALTNLLKRAIADDHFPLSPRVQTLQGILDRLETTGGIAGVQDL